MRSTTVCFLGVSLSFLACRGPAEPRGPVPDLAVAFEESVHGFTPLAPAMRGAHDALEGARYDEGGRLVLEPGGRFTSQLEPWSAPFDELLLSWNVDVPAGAAFAVEVLVESRARGERSPWMLLGGWGDPALAPRAEASDFDGARVDVDVVRASRPFDAFRYRLSCAPKSTGPVAVAACCAAVTDTARLAQLDAGPLPETARPALAVPALSQRNAPPALAARVCSPTSVAMVLAYHGIDVPLAALAAEMHDPAHDLYGNWPRAVQAAYAHGVPGALVRLSSWRAVAHFLDAGIPLVVSVGAGPGELAGAPYAQTSGHLLVLTGLAPPDRVLVNDPAAPTAEEVPRTYAAADLERCWMRRNGVAYALAPSTR